ncbi:hypothetical protein [Nocardiopsis protaetiae]|uniref:hypothetical protein n=1 Tax=Nocardiopsis protaetiae TaxID=3382270 RepID=UPI00387B48C6
MSRPRMSFEPDSGSLTHWRALRHGQEVGRYSRTPDGWEAHVPGRTPYPCGTETAARLWLIDNATDTPVVEPGPAVPLADVVALLDGIVAALDLPITADPQAVRYRIAYVQGAITGVDHPTAVASATRLLGRVARGEVPA